MFFTGGRDYNVDMVAENALPHAPLQLCMRATGEQAKLEVETIERVRTRARAYTCAHVRVRACACAHARVRVRVRVRITVNTKIESRATSHPRSSR